jgi:hypothetical protein
MKKNMTTTLEKKNNQIGESLSAIKARIKNNLGRMEEIAVRATYDIAIQIGKDLLKAEKLVTGNWYDWLDANFRMSRETARRYMMLSRDSLEKRSRNRHASISDALRERSAGYAQPRQRVDEQPIRNILDDIDTDVFAERQKTETKERRLKKEMALELVEAGFRALSHRLHSDKGGNDDAMRRLDEVRKILKQSITRNEISFQNE